MANFLAEDLIEVNAFLRDGDVVAVPSGNMAAVYRVRNDAMNGEAYLAFWLSRSLSVASGMLRLATEGQKVHAHD